ncbi:Down syndrome cell adhesion molecule-like protein Dscam2 [Acanthaster planci]|uniref:Down syndrome cell adhesion molecule-like protein Dscam2 n=1 Tax=Acanthaster planci TaxID=133434 RepID=A0A8B8A110_ACAPL|nr:Down syndrome cell adhesion molecule-like protein Dscam2 [Acanthaster planci]
MALKFGGVIPTAVHLLIILPWMDHHAVRSQPMLDEGPQDAAVHVGQEVTFVCDLRNVGDYGIFWFQQQRNMYLTSGRQVSDNLLRSELRERVSIVGRADQEEFNLKIVNVQVADEGEYFCRHALPEGDYTNSGRAELLVLIPPTPESPLCEVIPLSVNSDHFDVGDEVQLHCYQKGGNPPPDLTFLRDGNQLSGPGRTITHRYLLSEDDNGVTFTCIMTTPALNEPRNCSVIPLSISPSATISPSVSWVEEGTSGLFECSGEGIPNIARYRWRVTNANTRGMLPTNRYTTAQSANGQSLEIVVTENLDLLCIVSVPSGLSGNATATVQVKKQDMTTLNAGSTVQTSPTTKPSPPAAFPIAAVVIPLLTVMAVFAAFIALCLWRRKRQRKLNISIRYKTSVRCDESDYGAQSRRDGQITHAGNDFSASTGSEVDTSHMTYNPLYATSDNHQVGQTPNQSYRPNQPSSKPKPDMRAVTRQQDAIGSPVESVGHPQDIPLYSTPNKKGKGLGELKYSNVPVEEPEETDSGLVYADLDLEESSPSKDIDNNGLPPGSDQTVYAMIRS